MTRLLLGALVSATVIVLAGTLLARSADVIAARSKLGGVWIGSMFLAAATSLPELVTEISAVRIGAPDLAAGDLFGSSMANMLILALVTLAPGGAHVFRQATLDHALYAALAITMTGVAATLVITRPAESALSIGYGSWLLLAIYVVASRTIYRRTTLAASAVAAAEMGGAVLEAPVTEGPLPSLRRARITFAASAGAILFAAPLFARSAEGIAEATGLGSTFVGTWLVGFSTSLPELVTSLAAVRMRAYDLAVGNLFGSNAFNTTLLAAMDIANGGSIYPLLDPTHALTAIVAIVLMAAGVAALVYRAQGRLTLLEPSSAVIILGYVMGLALIFSAVQ